MKRIGRLKATSLVEVLIVLAIISSTILGSMLLVSNSFVVVRQDQTQDYVNGLVVNAMEIVKSPSNIFVSNDTFTQTQNSTPVFFKLSKATGGGAFLDKTDDTQISTCTETSQYIINETTLATIRTDESGAPVNNPNGTEANTTPSPDVCVQVKIVPVAGSIVTNGIKGYYQMTVIAVYNQDDKPVIVTFQSNRYEEFKKTAI